LRCSYGTEKDEDIGDFLGWAREPFEPSREPDKPSREPSEAISINTIASIMLRE
jgi:hypothetical protein